MVGSENQHGNNVEFRILDYTVDGSDTVSFVLEDRTVVKVKVGIERVGVATNYRNPDGSPHYAVNTSVKLYIIPSERKFTIPKSQIQGQIPEALPGGKEPPSHIA
ncbi:MAG: hypothetical protein ABI361_00585 [Nitrososphaera sp.]|jgi:hypothetical protein